MSHETVFVEVRIVKTYSTGRRLLLGRGCMAVLFPTVHEVTRFISDALLLAIRARDRTMAQKRKEVIEYRRRKKARTNGQTMKTKLIALCLLTSASSLFGASLNLAWDRSASSNVLSQNLYAALGAGAFAVQMTLAPGDSTATVANLAAGALYRFQVTALGANGLESDPSNIFSFQVPVTNTPPTISKIASRTNAYVFSSTTTIIPLALTDAQTSAGSLTLTVTSSNPTLMPAANIGFGGSGGARTVIATPVPNRTGKTTITVTVSDGTLTASDAFDLTVVGPTLAP